jgi:hypothetical protein
VAHARDNDSAGQVFVSWAIFLFPADSRTGDLVRWLAEQPDRPQSQSAAVQAATNSAQQDPAAACALLTLLLKCPQEYDVRQAALALVECEPFNKAALPALHAALDASGDEDVSADIQTAIDAIQANPS